MTFEIKNWITGKVMFTLEGPDWKLAFKAAVKAGQEFKEADLSGIDFSGIEINGATFDNSTFDNSKFDNSKFDNSKFDNSTFDNSTFDNSTFDNSTFDNSKFDNSTFDNSTFDNSKFYNSTFDNSTFDNSTFYNSTFYNSTFYNSTFYNSTFYNSKFDNSTFDKKSFAGLPSQWLIQARDDLWSILLTVPSEVAFLRKALVDGKVDGSTYTGTCACLVGTIANARDCEIDQLGILKPNSRRPAEIWFLQIRPGGVPEKNPFAKQAVQWIDDFIALQKEASKVFVK